MTHWHIGCGQITWPRDVSEEKVLAEIAAAGYGGAPIFPKPATVAADRVALFQRFDLRCFAWDCQFVRNIQDMAKIGINGIFSDWPDRFYELNDSSTV